MAALPLAFLFLMVPLPETALRRISIVSLQKGSADITAVLFRLAEFPLCAMDSRFALPGVHIDVAEQCSGIRSSQSLFITGLLLSYVFLDGYLETSCLVVLTIPFCDF